MKNSTRLLLIVYLIWLIAELYTETIQWDFPLIHAIVKGGLMPILILMTSLARNRFGKLYGYLFVAQLLSWFGDLLLLQKDDNLFFILGLASFLLAQIGYALLFFKAMEDNFEQIVLRKYPLTLIIPIAISGVIFSLLKDSSGELMLPVLFYTVAITIMLLATIARFRKTSRQSFYLTLIGAAIFMLSDSLIAFNKFDHPITDANIWIMSTYGIAQLLLALGMLSHFEEWQK